MKQLRIVMMILLCCSFLLFSTVVSAEVYQTEVTFRDVQSSRLLTYPATIDDTWFNDNSELYHHNIAIASIGLATSAFRSGQQAPDMADCYLLSFMRGAGFVNYRPEQFDQKPTVDSIASAIAMKQLTDEKGAYTLIAVGVSGQGYGNEWVSNFTIESSDSNNQEHAGFEQAAQVMYKRIMDYRAEFAPEGRVKLWMSGFSRAAAVSNLTAALILNEDVFEKDGVFVYTFGTPNCTKDPVAWPQIINICNSMDPVPKVPLSLWGYQKNGVTHYLPAFENTANYSEIAERAADYYGNLVGDRKAFYSSSDRNWLVSLVVGILGRYFPSVENYADGMQQALSAAWLTDGNIANKLATLLDVLSMYSDNSEQNNEIKDQIENEFIAILQRGAYDSLGELIGESQHTDWLDTVSGGINIAHEHYPEVYTAWMRSGLTPEELFGHPANYLQISWTGELENIIVMYEEDNEDEIQSVLYDDTNGLRYISNISLGNQTFVNLPLGSEYVMVFTAVEDTDTQISWNIKPLQELGDASIRTSEFSVKKGERLSVIVPSDLSADVMLQVYREDGSMISADMDAEETTASVRKKKSIEHTISGMIVIIPFLALSTVLLIYAIVVLLLRIAHKAPVHDKIGIRPSGKFVLFATASLSLGGVVHYLTLFFETLSSKANISLQNQAMLRLSSYLGISINAYHASGIVIFALVCCLCLSSIHHGASRQRLRRLAIMLLILNSLEIVAADITGAFSWMLLLLQLVPILALIGLRLGRVPDDIFRLRNKYWRSIKIAATSTLLMFLLRQLLLFAVHDPTRPLLVIMKALTGIPAVIIALIIYRQVASKLHCYIAIALGVCFLADTVINLSTMTGMALFAVAHGLLLYGFRDTLRPSRGEVISTLILSVLMIGSVIGISAWLPTGITVPACFYSVIAAAMTVSSFRQDRRIRTGAIIFLMADIMVGLKIAFPGNILMDFSELMLYYVGLMIMAADGNTLVPEELRITYDIRPVHSKQ